MEAIDTGGLSPEAHRNLILSNWKQWQDRLNEAKKEEAELRAQVIALFSERTDEMATGTETLDIGWGHELKIVHKLDYKLDNSDDYAKTAKALRDIENALGEEVGPLIVERLIKRELSIKLTEYKQLPDVAKAIIDKVLTIKPAAKSVEMVKV